MAYVIPFRGLRYNQKNVPNLAQVVSPPYDIITPAEQELYYRKDPHNSIRLDYGREEPGDNGNNNRYLRAAAALGQWTEENVVSPDPEPSLYFLREEFTGPGGEQVVREGFIAAVRLEEFSEGVILPHEETAPGPKEDRLRLMKATEANLSPIFMLYSDPDRKIAGALKEASSREPGFSLTDESGTRHTMWVVSDPAATSFVTEALTNEKLLIADGHHRYETALAYRNGLGNEERSGSAQPYDYMMVYLSNLDNSSGSVLPIHRLVCGLEAETLNGIVGLLERDFEIEEIPETEQDRAGAMLAQMSSAGREKNVFGVYLPATGGYYLLVARRSRPMLDAAKTGHSEAWRGLEVSVLDRLILAELLGIAPGGRNADATVKFVERTGNALRQAENCDVAFFVNPTSMQEIKAVAEAGEKMPQKSTYFYPKPLTGLVFRSFKY